MKTKAFSGFYFNFPLSVFRKHSNGMSIEEFFKKVFVHNVMHAHLLGDKLSVDEAVKFETNGDEYGTLTRIKGYICYNPELGSSTTPFLDDDEFFGIDLKILWDKGLMATKASTIFELVTHHGVGSRFPSQNETFNSDVVHFEFVSGVDKVGFQNGIDEAKMNEINIPWYFRNHYKKYLERVVKVNSADKNRSLFASTLTDGEGSNPGLYLICGSDKGFVSAKKLVKILSKHLGGETIQAMKRVLELHRLIGSTEKEEQRLLYSTEIRSLIGDLYCAV